MSTESRERRSDPHTITRLRVKHNVTILAGTVLQQASHLLHLTPFIVQNHRARHVGHLMV